MSDSHNLIQLAAVVGLALAIALAMTGAFFLGSRFWLWVGGGAATLQIYTLPIAGIYPSLSLISGLGTCGSVRWLPQLLRHQWFAWLVLLIIAQTLSIAWSPNKIAGIRHIVYLLPFVFVCAAMYQLTMDSLLSGQKILKITMSIAVVEALLVIVFRIYPAIEAAYLKSTFAGLFISPNTLRDLFGDQGNNVFDPAKSGGLFVNANFAATFLGVCAISSWFLAKASGSHWMRWVAGIHWVGVFFCGSKAGLLAALVVPITFCLARFFSSNRFNAWAVVVGCFVIAVVVALIPLAYQAFDQSGFTRESYETFSTRQTIWKFASDSLMKSPFLGLGFGGWEAKFPAFALSFGINQNLPAHNAFIILWTQSGLLALIAGVGFLVSLLRWLISLRDQEGSISSMALGLIGAFSWYFFQGQGENFGILGEGHLTPILAMLVGHTVALVDMEKVEL